MGSSLCGDISEQGIGTKKNSYYNYYYGSYGILAGVVPSGLLQGWYSGCWVKSFLG